MLDAITDISAITSSDSCGSGLDGACALDVPAKLKDAPGGRMCILVVEDEPLIRDAVVWTLEESGYDVVDVGTAAEAETHLNGQRCIDMLITDVRMPGARNGWDLAELARSLNPHLKVLYMSGHSRELPRQVPGSIYLRKPFDLRTLVTAVERLEGGEALQSTL